MFTSHVIFYILCHRCPYPLDMVLTSLIGIIFEIRASEVSDVAGTSRWTPQVTHSNNRIALIAVHAKPDQPGGTGYMPL